VAQGRKSFEIIRRKGSHSHMPFGSPLLFFSDLGPLAGGFSLQLEVNDRIVYDKKRKLRQAIESGKPIPTELREEVGRHFSIAPPPIPLSLNPLTKFLSPSHLVGGWIRLSKGKVFQLTGVGCLSPSAGGRASASD
jgi:hypothetical protein